VLTQSVVLAAVLGVVALLVGLVAGSMAIIYDGLFSVIGVAMGLLTLWVARLVNRDEDRTFQYGYWHIEPMMLTLYGGMMMVLCLYGFVESVLTLMSGGREVELGWAVGYAAVMTVVCFAMYLHERRANRVAESELLDLDARDWLISALSTVAVLVGFLIAFWMKSTPYAAFVPYVDPTVVAVLCLAMLPVPVATVRRAASEVLLMTPSDLDARVRDVMEDVVARHGFAGFTSYSAKVGRGRFVEIHVIVPPDRPIGQVGELDAVRAEVEAALEGLGGNQWLTVDFTGDERWT